MSVNGKPRARGRRGGIRRFARRVLGAVLPTERQILTREGFIYFTGGVLLLFAGLYQQVNLILLVFTLSAGPFLASIFGGRAMLRRLSVRAGYLRTFFPAILWCSTTLWKMGGAGLPPSRCSSKIPWSLPIGRPREM